MKLHELFRPFDLFKLIVATFGSSGIQVGGLLLI
jgi:hypothetical protein